MNRRAFFGLAAGATAAAAGLSGCSTMERLRDKLGNTFSGNIHELTVAELPSHTHTDVLSAEHIERSDDDLHALELHRKAVFG